MNPVKTWATLAGIVLVATGLLGFLGTPLVGSAAGALVPTDGLHNVVHLGTGALALWIAFGTTGKTQVDALLGFGILYVVIFVAVAPARFGIRNTSGGRFENDDTRPKVVLSGEIAPACAPAAAVSLVRAPPSTLIA